jgi:hypothetical protein
VRFHDGSTNRETRSGSLALLAILLVLALPCPALAGKLVEVRVGRHPGYTRVVLQTDSPVEYTITRSMNGNVRVVLEADAEPRRLDSKSDVLREVIVEDLGDTSVARLRLHRPDVEVKELVLKSPPRIVLDLTPGVPQPVAQEAPVALEPVPALAKTEAAVEAEPAVAAEPVAPVEEMPALVESEAPAVPEPTVAEADAPIEPSPAREETGAPAESERALEPEAPVASGRLVDEPLAAAEPSTLAAADAAPTGEHEPAGLSDMPAPPPARQAPESPPPSLATQSPGVLGFLPTPLDDPLVLGGIAGLLVLIAALVAVRRRAAAGSERELESPFASGEAPIESGVREPLASFDVSPPFEDAHADTDLPAMPGQHTDDQRGLFSQSSELDAGDSLFGGEPEADEEKETGGGVFVAPEPADTGEPVQLVPGGEVMRVVEDLERRMGQMETRLEEVMDAKERLERQVSAQTEELRVQRAAIARTQRVLRNVSRPEDEATEPAPKV